MVVQTSPKPSRKQRKQERERAQKVKRLARRIHGCVTSVTDRAIYGEFEEEVLIQLGRLLGVIQDPSPRPDRRTGHRKLQQGDNQALVRDALYLAVERGYVAIYRDGSRMAVHEPRAVRRTLVAVGASWVLVKDYLPSEQDYSPWWYSSDSEPSSMVRTPHAGTALKAARWNN